MVSIQTSDERGYRADTSALRYRTEALALAPRSLLIAGEWVEGESGRAFAIDDPSSGGPVQLIADATPSDAMNALQSAHEAMGDMRRLTPRDRACVLRTAAGAIERASEPFAALIAMETGKPLAEAKCEVAAAVEYLEWFAEEAVRIDGRMSPAADGGVRHLIARKAIGPTLVVSPWNFPLAVAARGVAPALAAGCSVVLRPSNLAPLSASAFARVLSESGVPSGAINFVASTDDHCTDPLLTDPRLRKLTFTGSTTVGRDLLRLAATRMLRVTAELGGQAPFIVFADADLDLAVEGAVIAKTRNGGQACTAANTFLVERDIAEEFTRRLADRFAALQIGPGLDSGVDMGPMISERHRERLDGILSNAIALGATVALNGGSQSGPGYYFSPCLLTDVPAQARVLNEEIFGPIAAVQTFTREKDAVILANSTNQGLAGYVYTSNLGRAMRVAESLEVGMVGINQPRVSFAETPFGGVKQSGYGRSGGTEGLDEYLDVQTVAVRSPAESPGRQWDGNGDWR